MLGYIQDAVVVAPVALVEMQAVTVIEFPGSLVTIVKMSQVHAQEMVIE